MLELSLIAIPLGLFAGGLSTVAGMGGGMIMVLILSVLYDPKLALAATAPALMVGNLHRLWMFRVHADWRTGGRIVLGAMPGALFGGLVAASLPSWVLYAAMLGMSCVAVAKYAGRLTWTPPPRTLTPVGFGIGALTANAGGAGLLVSPLLMSAGLTGLTYISTASISAISMHIGRLSAYGLGGMLTSKALTTGALLAVFITAGNAVGRMLRGRFDEVATRRIEIGTLVTCVALAVTGVSR